MTSISLKSNFRQPQAPLNAPGNMESPNPDRESAPSGTEPSGDPNPVIPAFRPANIRQIEAADEASLEREVLSDIDEHFEIFDNPGGGDTDGVISRSDLERVSTGDFNEEAARERLAEDGIPEDEIDATLEQLQGRATQLLNNNALFDRIDNANDRGNGPDGKIARSDLNAYLFDAQDRVADSGQDLGTDDTGLRDGEFELPHEDHTHVVRQGEDNRTDALISEQEEAVLDALNQDGPIEFTNSSGETEQIELNQVNNTKGDVEFELTGEDGHTIRVTSELSAEQTRVALARILDYHTQTPEHLRGEVDRIELHEGGKPGKPNSAADYNSDKDRLRFFNGLKDLNEAVFDHEVGHSVGYGADGIGESNLDRFGNLFIDTSGEGAPQGWSEAIEQDGGSVSDYANTNLKEDFAESWSTYVEARESGELEQFKAAYPHRFEILEAIYEGR